MSDAFTVLWTHGTCRALRKVGRVGGRPPGRLQRRPFLPAAWPGARAWDEAYALHVNRCVVYVVSWMRVIDMGRRDCCGAGPATWQGPAFPGHSDWSMLGADGCGATAVHVEATPVRFDMPIPGDLLARLAWRNRRGQTRGLKYRVDGRLERSISLQGFYRLTSESAGGLAEVFGDAL